MSVGKALNWESGDSGQLLVLLQGFVILNKSLSCLTVVV